MPLILVTHRQIRRQKWTCS